MMEAKRNPDTMQRLGQHFLKNRSALRLIADSIASKEEDLVVEVGPGHGELTEFLKAAGKRVVAIEKDRKLYDALAEKFGGDPRMTFVAGDARDVLPTVVHDISGQGINYHVVGNIPYYITGQLMRIVGDLEPRPESCIFTIQKEVAERICAAPPRMNRLAASVQFWAEPSILKVLKASDFMPPPKVDSAILLLKTSPPKKVEGDYYAAVRALFAQPRKTIGNNIAAGTGKSGKIVADELSPITIDHSARPQDLSIKDIWTIADTFFKNIPSRKSQ